MSKLRELKTKFGQAVDATEEQQGWTKEFMQEFLRQWSSNSTADNVVSNMAQRIQKREREQSKNILALLQRVEICMVNSVPVCEEEFAAKHHISSGPDGLLAHVRQEIDRLKGIDGKTVGG